MSDHQKPVKPSVSMGILAQLAGGLDKPQPEPATAAPSITINLAAGAQLTIHIGGAALAVRSDGA